MISIHAPPRGATSTGNPAVQCQYFNSRPSARGDALRGHRRRKRRISIHAPPRGATYIDCGNREARTFQFTPLREGRRDRLYADGGRAEFQFTPLREGRPAAGQAWRGYNRFQFTPLREGRQLMPVLMATFALISIHAPPRGATRPRRDVFSGNKFQFTPLREGRQHIWRYIVLCYISIHAPPRGATGCLAGIDPGWTISIHAPPRGATEQNAEERRGT